LELFPFIDLICLAQGSSIHRSRSSFLRIVGLNENREHCGVSHSLVAISSRVRTSAPRRGRHRESRENSMRHILVTGGTGTLGSHVVPELHDAGCSVRVLSRHSRAAAEGIEFVASDLTTGEGIAAAVEGIDVIVHLAGGQKGDDLKALNLVRAASRVGS